MRPNRPALFVVLALASGCQQKATLPDSGAAQPSLDASSVQPFLMSIEVELSDGGLLKDLLGPAPGPLVPPTAALTLTTSKILRNYRLRILDEIDRALPSDDTPEETANGLRYAVKLLAPLRPGHRYFVSLDAQSGPSIDDGSPAGMNEFRFEFHTDGERERDAPVKHPAGKRHHQRSEGN